MKKIIRFRAALRLACAAALLLSFASLRSVLRAAEASAAASLTHELMGKWVYVGAPGKLEPPPAKGGFIKLRTTRYWSAIGIDPRTGLVGSTHGGSWRVDGDVYQETIDFGGELHASIMNRTLKWKVKVEGDLMTMTPLDNPYNEVWQRVK